MPSRWTIILHSIISFVILSLGLYVLIEKKMIVSGKLTGDLYEYEYPGNILVALSFLFVSAFVMLVLVKDKRIKRINEILILSAMILFFVGTLFYT
jgi:hypothetical protein